MTDISVLVEGGKASAGAPLGPALGPSGVNIGQVVQQINEKTKEYSGMKVPVTVKVDSANKTFEIIVGSPPVSALIKKEINIQKGADNPKTNLVGNLTLEQVKKIAKMKIENLSSSSVKASSREIIGVANSMGVTIEGKPAKEFQKEIAEGKHDAALEK